ncbi:MAG: hypothetical protein KDC14_00200 [Planctomycetes bacterium]|nr:hypothetical protein [Planctomycetota bacterium]
MTWPFARRPRRDHFPRILAIMPAGEWVAAFAPAAPGIAFMPSPRLHDPRVAAPLVGWALVEFVDGERETIGLVIQDDRTVLARFVSGFLGYAPIVESRRPPPEVIFPRPEPS